MGYEQIMGVLEGREAKSPGGSASGIGGGPSPQGRTFDGFLAQLGLNKNQLTPEVLSMLYDQFIRLNPQNPSRIAIARSGG